MTLHFTGRSDVEASLAAWGEQWKLAHYIGDEPRKKHAIEMRDRMARALREGE